MRNTQLIRHILSVVDSGAKRFSHLFCACASVLCTSPSSPRGAFRRTPSSSCFAAGFISFSLPSSRVCFVLSLQSQHALPTKAALRHAASVPSSPWLRTSAVLPASSPRQAPLQPSISYRDRPDPVSDLLQLRLESTISLLPAQSAESNSSLRGLKTNPA